MELADEGDFLRRRGSFVEASQKFADAYQFEAEAAAAVTVEPSRSILYRSAAWLALEAGRARDAERMAAKGLAGDAVPKRVAQELRAVLEDAQYSLNTPEAPAPGEKASLELTLRGGEVGYGHAPAEQIYRRLDLLQKLVLRTAERQAGLAFRKGGRPKSSVAAKAKPQLRVGAGSFKLRFEFGREQMSLWPEGQSIVQEVMRGIAALEEGDDALKRQIPNKTYRRNFKALIRGLSPDGTRVEKIQVGASFAGETKQVIISRRPKEVKPKTFGTEQRELVSIVGELLAADGTGKQGRITLVPSEGADPLRVAVNHAILEDIVRPNFGRRVRAHLEKRLSPAGAITYLLVDFDENVDEDDD